MNAIAFVLDGLYYGVSDFGFAAYSMVMLNWFFFVYIYIYVSPLMFLKIDWSHVDM